MNAVVLILLRWNNALGKWKFNLEGLGISRRHWGRVKKGKPPENATLSDLCLGVWEHVQASNGKVAWKTIFDPVREFLPSSPETWTTAEDLRLFLIENIDTTYTPPKISQDEFWDFASGDDSFGPDDFFPSFIYPAKPGDHTQNIKEIVAQGLNVPPALLYASEEGAYRWFDMCEDPSFAPYQDSSAFISKSKALIVEKVVGQSSRVFNVVSLGPGNGQKDRMLLHAFVERTQEQGATHYYPFDINPIMLSKAWRTVRGEPLLSDSVTPIGFIGDFRKLPFAAKRFRKEASNVILLLGNTLGNMERDGDFVRQIHAMMQKEDRAVIEVRQKSATNSPGGSAKARERFNIAPLEDAGVVPEEGKFNWIEEDGCSQIPGTKTRVGIYGPYDPPWDTSQRDVETRLTLINHYDPKKFKTFLLTRFAILGEFYSSSTMLFVLKKSSAKS